MKKAIIITMILAILLITASCAKMNSASAWQEQYDLGTRYLDDGNYQEAIIAFQAAIDIDPARADPWIGLADALYRSGNAEGAVKTLNSAKASLSDEVYEENDMVNKLSSYTRMAVEEWLDEADQYIEGMEYDRARQFLTECEGKFDYHDQIAQALRKLDITVEDSVIQEVDALIENKEFDKAAEALEANRGQIKSTQKYERALERLNTAVEDSVIREVDVLIESKEFDKAAETLEANRDQIKSSERYENTRSEIEHRRSWDEEGRTVVDIGTAEELLNALETYNHDSALVLSPGETYMGYYDPDDVFTPGFNFHNLDNVIIWGDGETEFLCQNLYVPVIKLTDCRNVVLHGLIVGHLPEVDEKSSLGCPQGGDVIVISSETEETEVTVENCDLFGCGFSGIVSYKNTQVYVKETAIHDCSLKIASVFGQAVFEKCSFVNNAYAYPLYLERGWATSLEYDAKYIIETGEEPLTFNDCVFENNFHPHLTAPDAQCEFNDCTFSGNAWE